MNSSVVCYTTHEPTKPSDKLWPHKPICNVVMDLINNDQLRMLNSCGDFLFVLQYQIHCIYIVYGHHSLILTMYI